MVKFLVHVLRVLRFKHPLAVYCKSTNLTFTKINFKNALNVCKGFFQHFQSTYISVPMVLTNYRRMRGSCSAISKKVVKASENKRLTIAGEEKKLK